MKTHVVKTSPDASLAEAVDLMDIYQINSVPVVDVEGKLCGFLSEQDIALAAKDLWHAELTSDRTTNGRSRTQLSEAIAKTPVANVMKLEVASIFEEDSIEDSLRTIFVNDYTRLPVLNLMGMLSVR